MISRSSKSLFLVWLLVSFIFTSFCAQEVLPESELLGKGTPNLVRGSGYSLRSEAAQAFEKMKTAALEDGILLQSVSSYRSYDHQNRIWERKYKRFRESGLTPTQSINKIIEYSTIPGTSRHHWGTDIDLIDGNKRVSGDVLVPSKFHGNGPFCAMKEWMDEHANTYGFYLVYTDVAGREGFNYEPWHYTYKPLSKEYLKLYKKLDVKHLLQEAQLMGSEQFNEMFIDSYISKNILDINPELFD